jgi:hypothetical protein
LFVSFFLVNLALQNLNAYKNITGNYLSISMAVSSTEYFSKKKKLVMILVTHLLEKD